jgi:hypothetical protein
VSLVILLFDWFIFPILILLCASLRDIYDCNNAQKGIFTEKIFTVIFTEKGILIFCVHNLLFDLCLF